MDNKPQASSSKFQLKNLAFTLSVIVAVVWAMIFPEHFTTWGSFKVSSLIIPLLMLIMFGMGTTMSIHDFAGVVKMPKAILAGLLCQFTIMPIVGLLLVLLAGLPNEIAAGVILVGSSPSGLASNVMSYISKSNVALSITLTAFATILAPFLTPLLMKLLASSYVPVDVLGMLWSITKIVLLPIIAGLAFNHFFYERFKLFGKIMPIVSMTGIVVIIAVITASGRDSLLSIGFLLIGIVTLHNLIGYTLGYWITTLLGMDKKSARTIAFEVGMQNSGLASGIAAEMGRLATMGLAPALFSIIQNITGSILSGFWRKDVKKM
ncbi:MAG: bile acid:sodium symporter family protein [Balneolaceae bacterium]|nr:bile acid:sodium symporter family protein [Balneolaceae bacterium]MBO6544917.1 bile acid:sodium symporter family protein [Balneolaceae bacterium]MBO6646313.1 bile acid:sodium symporter family protein [Balneolaceae bacterium]